MAKKIKNTPSPSGMSEFRSNLISGLDSLLPNEVNKLKQAVEEGSYFTKKGESGELLVSAGLLEHVPKINDYYVPTKKGIERYELLFLD